MAEGYEIAEVVHKPIWMQIDPDRPAAGYRCVHEGAGGACDGFIYDLRNAAPIHVKLVKAGRPQSLPGALAESLAKALLDNEQLRERVAVAEKNARDAGFEVARLSPLAATTKGWKAKAAQLEVELAVLRAHVLGVDDWLEQHIEVGEWEIEAKDGSPDRWDEGWTHGLKLARDRLRAGQHPAYEVDNGCECGGVCPNCARWGCETCCDGEMPSAHGSRDGSVQTFDYDDLRRHLVSAHRNGAALGLSDYEAMDEHDHEHRGPGTIRNHDVDSRDWSQDRIDETIAELKKMEGGGSA